MLFAKKECLVAQTFFFRRLRKQKAVRSKWCRISRLFLMFTLDALGGFCH